MFIEGIIRHSTKICMIKSAHCRKALADQPKVHTSRFGEEYSINVGSNVAELSGDVGIAIAVLTGEGDESATQQAKALVVGSVDPMGDWY